MDEAQTPDEDQAQQMGRSAADWTLWFFVRYVIGSAAITQLAGMLHLDVWPSFPHWSFTQSQTVTLALLVVAFIFRR